MEMLHPCSLVRACRRSLFPSPSVSSLIPYSVLPRPQGQHHLVIILIARFLKSLARSSLPFQTLLLHQSSEVCTDKYCERLHTR